jgi:hypothetical protein
MFPSARRPCGGRRRFPLPTVVNGASGSLPPGVQFFTDDHGAAYLLENPQAGEWQVTVDVQEAPDAGVDYSVVQFMEASYDLTPLAVEATSPGGTVTLAAGLTGSLSGAVVTAEATRPGGSSQVLTLLDDGSHSDGAAGDGVYGALYTAPVSTGPVSVRYVAQATTPEGHPLLLSAHSGFTVADLQTITVDRVLAERTVQEADKFARLEVDVEVSFSGHNPFHLLADLMDPSGVRVAKGRAEVHGDPGSTVVATLIFKGEDIAASGLNGPYTVKNFFIFKPEGFDRAFNNTLTFETPAYTAAQFPLKDADEDGLSDKAEASLGTDPKMRDTDMDGVLDGGESALGTDPKNRDTDGDTWMDGLDVFPLDRFEWSDRDGDGVGDNGDGFPDDPTRWENPNQAPTAEAGAPQTVEASTSTGADVSLNGTASSDPDEGDTLSYMWTWAGGSAAGSTPTVHLPLGVSTITLVISDGNKTSSPDTVTVTVRDTTAPVLSGRWDRVAPGYTVFRLGWGAVDAVDPAPLNGGILEMPSLEGFTVIGFSSATPMMVVDFTERKVWTSVPNPEALMGSIRTSGGLVLPQGQGVWTLPPLSANLWAYILLENNILQVRAPSPSLKVAARDASGNGAILSVPAPQ